MFLGLREHEIDGSFYEENLEIIFCIFGTRGQLFAPAYHQYKMAQSLAGL